MSLLGFRSFARYSMLPQLFFSKFLKLQWHGIISISLQLPFLIEFFGLTISVFWFVRLIPGFILCSNGQPVGVFENDFFCSVDCKMLIDKFLSCYWFGVS